MIDKATEQAAEDVVSNEVVDDFEIIEALEDNIESSEQVDDVEVLEPYQAPEYFKSEHKEMFDKLTDMEGGRAYQEAWTSQWDNAQSDYTKKFQELSGWEQERKTFGEYQQAINPLMNQWKLQGMNPAMGLAQLAQYGVGLQSDPQGTLNKIAEAYGIDMNKLVEDQPYVDPQVRELQQQQAQMQQQHNQQMQNWQQQQMQQNNDSIMQQINAFSTAKDSNGELKNVHYETVREQMAEVINLKQADNLDDAYKLAIKYNPDVQAELRKAELAKNQAEVKKAANATTGIKSKTNSAPDDDMTLEQSIESNLVYN